MSMEQLSSQQRVSDMKRIFIVFVAAALLVGCDYTVPLVEDTGLPIDSAFVGTWQRIDDKRPNMRLLVLPMSEQEYLVMFTANADNALFARALLWHGEDTTLAQLDWLGTGRGKLPEDDRTFQYAAYKLDEDTLTIRLLNPRVVPRDITSSDGLAAAITDNRDHPDLFREEMVFQRFDSHPDDAFGQRDLRGAMGAAVTQPPKLRDTGIL